MSEFIRWEFSANNIRNDDRSGTALYSVGSKSIMVKCESFGQANDLGKLIQQAYEYGRDDGIAEITRRINFAVSSE